MVAIGYGYVITNVAQLSLGTTAFVAGSLVLPGALVGAVCAPLGGWFYDKFGAVKPILIPLGIAILGPVLMLVFSMQLTPVLLAGFYFIFGLFYSIGNANVMTSGLSEVSPEFKPDATPFSTRVFSLAALPVPHCSPRFFPWLRPAQEKKAPLSFAHATAVGGTWTFATMTVICLIGWCCLAPRSAFARHVACINLITIESQLSKHVWACPGRIPGPRPTRVMKEEKEKESFGGQCRLL